MAGGAEIDYSQDFFGRRAYLTVSGQLNGEYYASALSNIYTFGPTFRAEDSHTSRHLAEFWMIEPEMAFCALEDDMQCAEDYVRHCCAHLLKSSKPDLDFLVDRCGTLPASCHACLCTQDACAHKMPAILRGSLWLHIEWCCRSFLHPSILLCSSVLALKKLCVCV